MTAKADTSKTRRFTSGPNAFIGVGILAAAAAASLDSSHAASGPVICPVRLLTGLPCPGCGLVRSWVATLDGNLALAASLNPFGIVLLVLLAGAIIWRLTDIIGSPLRVGPAAPPALRIAGAAIITLWAGWGSLRMFGLIAQGDVV